MARRSVGFYLVKVVRVSGWFLFLLVPVYIVTGYAVCGKLGMSERIDPADALAVHRVLDVPLIVLFLAHSAPATVLALRRWKWPRRTKRQ